MPFIGSNGEDNAPDWHHDDFLVKDEALPVAVNYYGKRPLSTLTILRSKKITIPLIGITSNENLSKKEVPFIGVQWHPEFLLGHKQLKRDQVLFDYFVKSFK